MERLFQESIDDMLNAVMEIDDETFTEIMGQLEHEEDGPVILPESVRDTIVTNYYNSYEYGFSVIDSLADYKESVQALPMSDEKKDFFGSLLDNLTEETLTILENGSFLPAMNVHLELGENAVLPEKKTTTDACYDLSASETVVLPPFSKRTVGTDLKMAIPEGFEGQVRLRSGISQKTPLILANGVGTIDAGYRGELKISLANLSEEPYVVEKGTRIAQLKLSPVYNINWIEVKTVEKIGKDRRGGFGSSGTEEMER